MSINNSLSRERRIVETQRGHHHRAVLYVKEVSTKACSRFSDLLMVVPTDDAFPSSPLAGAEANGWGWRPRYSAHAALFALSVSADFADGSMLNHESRITNHHHRSLSSCHHRRHQHGIGTLKSLRSVNCSSEIVSITARFRYISLEFETSK